MSSILTSSNVEARPVKPYLKKPHLILLLTSMLILATPCLANAAQWKLEKHGEDYQISIQGSRGDKLVLYHEGEDTRFILLTAAERKQPDKQRILQLWFDKDTDIIKTDISRLNTQSYLIQLSSSQKSEILNQMINRLQLQVRYPVDDQSYRTIVFSLLGFTAVLNDLLIAHEIGHLDPEWLNENHKTQELMCYYAANFSVLSMLYRKQGLSYAQSVNKIKKQYSDALDEVINGIVKQVYDIPRSKLPRDPRGDKFGIFQRCMQHYQE